jgi:dethiobiotin synthetase
LLIEGVGGVMAPLDARHTVLDWVAALDIPLVLVAGSYLGTISHTLTALEVLRRRGLDVACLVISESASSPPPLDETRDTIARFTSGLDVVALPRLADPACDHPAFDRIAEQV